MKTDERDTKAIEARLKGVLSTIRRAQALRACLIVGTVVLGGLLLAMAADLVFAPLAQGVRVAIFALWVVAVIVGVKVGWAPYFQKITLVRIARWLEGRHPEIEERMSTALELSGDGKVSPDLLAALLEAADVDAGKLDASGEVDAVKTTGRWGWPVVACVLVIVAALIGWPNETSRLLVRAVAPFSDAGNAGAVRFNVDPGDLEVVEGDAIEIRTSYDGPEELVEIEMAMEGGESVVQSMMSVDGVWFYRLEPARESFRYRVRAGRALSDEFEARVWPMPRLIDPMVALEFPAYVDRPVEKRGLSREVEAVIGTRLTISAKTNTAVEATWLELPGERRVDGMVEGGASEGRVEVSWVLGEEDHGEARIWLKHRLGREVEGYGFQVKAVTDQPPVVAWLSPLENEITVRPDERLDLQYEVIEDFGLSGVVLEVEAGKTVELSQVLPEKIGKTERFEGGIEVSVGELRARLEKKRKMRLRVTAEDARSEALGGRGRGSSDWLTVKINDSADSLARQQLRSEQEDAQKTLQEAIRKAEEARNRMDQIREPLVRGEKEEWVRKAQEKAQEDLAEAEEMVSKLAERMEKSVHAAKADEVRDASEKLASAKEDFEEVPLQDDEEKREEKLEEARQETEQAIEGMKKALEEVNRDHPKVEDLARVEEMAQRQRELARQAEEKAAAPEPMDETWQKAQEQMKWEMREQVKQRPEAEAEFLKAQAEAAKALAEEANEAAEEQQKLAEMAQQFSEQETLTEDQLRQELAEEQSKVAEAAREESMIEAANAGMEAKQQLESGELNRAAESARQASEEMKPDVAAAESNEAAKAEDAAGPSESETADAQEAPGDESLAERQEALAEATEALAKGDLESAAEHLDEARAENSNDLAEALGEMIAQEQAAIADEAGEQLAEARQERNAMADILPEAAAATESAKEALENGADETSAAATEEAAGAMEEAAKAAAEAASEAGGESAVEAAQQADALSELAERQEMVAEAAKALSEGDEQAVLESMQALAASSGEELAAEIGEQAQLSDGPMNAARDQANLAANLSKSAASNGQNEQQQAASGQHEQGAQKWDQSAKSLEQAAEQLAQQAGQASQRQADQNRAPVGASEMAEALSAAAEASSSEDAAEAAAHAREAAEALAQAAQQGRAQMQGRPKAQPGMANQPPGPQPGKEDSEDPARPAQADPGVPPELAKLGISADDWAKIQSNLKSDVGVGGGEGVPEGYRGLVKEYFEQISKGK